MSIQLGVDEWDVIDQISTSELEKELSRRTDRTREEQSAVEIAIQQIRRGDYLDAVTTLEREFLPKWRTAADSKRAYDLAMPKRRLAA